MIGLVKLFGYKSTQSLAYSTYNKVGDLVRTPHKELIRPRLILSSLVEASGEGPSEQE